ncbi:unnamed protein product [Discula destructiva]
MSAPPNGLPGGGRPPPGAPPLRRRKPASANPMVARKRPVPPPPPKPATSSNKAKVPPKPLDANHNFYGITAPKVDHKTQEEWKVRRRQNGGWWDPPPQADDYREVPVYITKKDIKEGLRLHAMRFSKARASGNVDIMDDTQFPRPVTLHRKDARDVHQPLDAKDASGSPAPVDEAEAERIAKIKEEKEAQRAVDQAQIAPVTKEAQARKPAQKEARMETKTFYAKRSAERQKENNLRYEESLPWVVEDADGKSVYVSQYLGPMSESMVALQFEGGNAVRAVPVEKFYKFTHKPPFKAYSIEEAEALMKKQIVPGRWSMRQDEKDKVKEEEKATRQFLTGRSMVKMESNTFKSAARSEKQEHDDIDFSGDEFQDDDEAPTFDRNEGDDDAKDSKERIRREQLGANLFGEADENEIEEELKREEAEEEARKRLGKSLTNRLVKLEKHLEYKDDPEDSSDLDVSSSSDDEDDPDKQDIKLENDKNAQDSKGKGPNGQPSATKPKHGPDGKKVNSLKRPGSPNLSEMESSGNESSRKRPKKNATGSFNGSRASTPIPGSQRSKKAPGAASDAEMSDGGHPTKMQKVLPVGSHSRGTPVASRAGSPVPESGSQSPNVRGGASSPPTPNPASGGALGAHTIKAEEIVAVLQAHPEGMTIGQLHKEFLNRLDGTQPDRQVFIALVKTNSKWGPDKLLRTK